MTAEELDEKAKDIINAYKGFKILKNGSKKDKVIFILIRVLFFIFSTAFFVTNVFLDNFIAWAICLICWVCIVIFEYSFQQYILKRETKVYIRGAKKETNFLNYFEEKIESCGIKRSNYNLYINYFTNELNLIKLYKTNEVSTYVTTIICPILISLVIKNQEFEALVVSILGIFVIPGIIFFINWFAHYKEYMYERIVYYLNKGLLLENCDK